MAKEPHQLANRAEHTLQVAVEELLYIILQLLHFSLQLEVAVVEAETTIVVQQVVPRVQLLPVAQRAVPDQAVKAVPVEPAVPVEVPPVAVVI